MAGGQGRPRSRAERQPARAGRAGAATLKKTLIIVNPNSGAGRTGRRWPAIARELEEAGLDFDTAFTKGPLEAIDLAREAVRQKRPLVVAAGGDGTVNEVANGFFEGGERIAGPTRLGVLPVGTGGDFRRSFGIPLEPGAAARVLIEGRPLRIDAGRATVTGLQGSPLVRHFVNIASAGIGGEVVELVDRSPKHLGGSVFMLASLVTLLRWRNLPMTAIVDGEIFELPAAQQVVVANCQYFGGGMRMAPQADCADGLFDVITVGDVSALENLRGLSKIRAGTHLEAGNPKWASVRGRRVQVDSPRRVRVEADGEQPGFLPAVFEIQPGALELMVPA
jgi:YegS/Rv2252/BmrU family lipid kinase